MSTPDDESPGQARQNQSDAAWASFVRTSPGGCFTFVLIVIVVASVIYGFFIA